MDKMELRTKWYGDIQHVWAIKPKLKCMHLSIYPYMDVFSPTTMQAQCCTYSFFYGCESLLHLYYRVILCEVP